MKSLTVITPTTGKPSLFKLIESIEAQDTDKKVFHLLLWDDKREPGAPIAELFNSENRFSIIAPPKSGRNGDAPGSLLRSIGLMAARTEWVTLADDDVWWEPNHLAELEKCSEEKNWGYTRRRIWTPEMEMVGVDNFESVGDSPSRRVPYEMCDGNTMFFKREYGSHAAVMYRETTSYNDDRLMYKFLKDHAGTPGQTNAATINHICPEKLIGFFKENCTRE